MAGETQLPRLEKYARVVFSEHFLVVVGFAEELARTIEYIAWLIDAMATENKPLIKAAISRLSSRLSEIELEINEVRKALGKIIGVFEEG